MAKRGQTRPDIMFAVRLISRFMKDYGEERENPKDFRSLNGRLLYLELLG